MGAPAATAIFVIALSSIAQSPPRPGAIRQEEIDYQSENFQRWWETPLVWKFSELPKKGIVPQFRVPYSGHDYPDRAGGTLAALYKYDRAFHRGRSMAAAYERWDITAHEEVSYVSGGFFGLQSIRVNSTPGWYGHCNGWTAAAIRHAEPQKNVVRNGVVFTPADIKGLLAEVYMYSDSEFLGGIDYAINPGTLHVIIANWVGRGSHPVGMETALGREVWNYPIYSFGTWSAERPGRQVEVKMSVRNALSTTREYSRSPRKNTTRYFHYMLSLNEEGKIVGGQYFGDSSRIDMLWVPLKPAQSGEEGNERGNRYLDVKEVLAIWRESVPESLREQWLNIDPTEEDRLLDPEFERLLEAATESQLSASDLVAPTRSFSPSFRRR